MQPEVLCILYVTSFYEQTGDIIDFAQFEQGNLVYNEHNLAKYESIPDSIDESYTYDESDDRYISTNTLEDIWDGK